MSQPDLDEEMRLIRLHFGFLFETGTRVISAYQYAQAFGNIIIELETQDLRIQFVRDRGEITVALETLQGKLVPDGEDWCDLIGAVWFLTQKQVLIAGYLDNRMNDEKQLELLAKALRYFYRPIIDLFQADTYSKNKDGLLLVFRELQQLFIDPHRSDEKQRLLKQSSWFWEQLDSP